MPAPIYLDNNATTRPLPEVLETVARVSDEAFANPGSQHQLGRKARRTLEASRESIAAILNAEPDELIFTSGGTESINLALLGLARGSGTLLTGPGEHPATRQTAAVLAQRGWKLREFKIDDNGRFTATDQAIDDPMPPRLVSCLLAHNETGVIQNLAPLISHYNAAGIPTHVDAVQAVGKIPISFHQLGATALSFGAHKFNGPRGIGGLIVRRGVKLAPLHFGGHQENGFRPGTEPVALIAGMARAIELWHDNAEARTAAMQSARDQLEQELKHRCPNIKIHGQHAKRLPNTSDIAFPGLNGEALLVALDLAGIACSLGSTCASGSAEPAPILLAMGVPRDIALATIRFSVGWDTTSEIIQQAASLIATTVENQMTVAQEGR